LSNSIFVLGSRSQLGSEIFRLLGEQTNVYGATRSDLDITDESAVVAYLRQIRPEVVIHCAAWTDVDACEADPDRAFAVNAEGTRHVASACREIGATMMYVSTDYVFDGQKMSPYVETDLPNPLSVYGRSKLAGEKATADLVEKHIIIRTSWMYGLTGKNFVRTMIDLGQQQLDAGKSGRVAEPIRVVNDQIGSPTYSVDLARQIQVILDRRLYGVFHASGVGQANWFAFASDIFSCLAMPVEVRPCSTKELGRPAPRPGYSALENRRLSDTGCNIMRPYQTALEEFLDQYRAKTV
jgi:dTDP-4-dehydrorhamnose reductase